jgi:glutathionyl-hydroquinone reductase
VIKASAVRDRGAGDLCLTASGAHAIMAVLSPKFLETAMPKYMLVSFKTCPWVQRSAIVFREKKVDFELRHI